jgi:hypothetical protein
MEIRVQSSFPPLQAASGRVAVLMGRLLECIRDTRSQVEPAILAGESSVARRNAASTVAQAAGPGEGAVE